MRQEKIICDRCKIRVADPWGIRKWELLRINVATPFDLCIPCKTSFEKWLKEGASK